MRFFIKTVFLSVFLAGAAQANGKISLYEANEHFSTGYARGSSTGLRACNAAEIEMLRIKAEAAALGDPRNGCNTSSRNCQIEESRLVSNGISELQDCDDWEYFAGCDWYVLVQGSNDPGFLAAKKLIRQFEPFTGKPVYAYEGTCSEKENAKAKKQAERGALAYCVSAGFQANECVIYRSFTYDQERTPGEGYCYGEVIVRAYR